MNFLSVKAVAARLKNGQMSERAKFAVFLMILVYLNIRDAISTAISNLPARAAFVMHMKDSGSSMFFPLIDVMLLIALMLILFRKYRKLGGENFVENFLCLSVPLAIQNFFFILAAGLAASIIGACYGSPLATAILVIESLFLFELIFYVRMNKWLSYIAAKKPACCCEALINESVL